MAAVGGWGVIYGDVVSVEEDTQASATCRYLDIWGISESRVTTITNTFVANMDAPLLSAPRTNKYS